MNQSESNIWETVLSGVLMQTGSVDKAIVAANKAVEAYRKAIGV